MGLLALQVGEEAAWAVRDARVGPVVFFAVYFGTNLPTIPRASSPLLGVHQQVVGVDAPTHLMLAAKSKYPVVASPSIHADVPPRKNLGPATVRVQNEQRLPCRAA